mgnify:CR=1 FL=1
MPIVFLSRPELQFVQLLTRHGFYLFFQYLSFMVIGILIYIRFSAISLPATKALRFSSTMASPLRWKMSRMLSCTFW